ncbi:Uu.00g092770.m01.CDS01 [Anthostomella pinea]|uniref:Uu.00g092770.m01.CDS01 n=1 Tax=Anthostomella pinea TaxID=933095 RepID=A0AAI8VNB2_9PEZI|nr:Uu.00g092770.m01.CDS01 [Anthostomella pinea]
MFDLPDVKRVRREDIYGAASHGEDSHDDHVDDALREKLQAQLAGLLGFLADEGASDEAEQSQSLRRGDESGLHEVGDGVDQPDEESFAFRLFRDEGPSHTVVLLRDRAPEGEGGFVVPRRPQSYYLAEKPSLELAERFRSAAVSVDHLLKDAKRRRWGLEKPWKVMTISIGTSKGARPGSSTSQSSNDSAGKRKRPGKKRRIILRVREKTKKEQEQAAKQQLVEKEQHLTDKKKRLNRLKKLRRRAKEKEKKQGANGDAGSEKSSRESSPLNG